MLKTQFDGLLKQSFSKTSCLTSVIIYFNDINGLTCNYSFADSQSQQLYELRFLASIGHN